LSLEKAKYERRRDRTIWASENFSTCEFREQLAAERWAARKAEDTSILIKNWKRVREKTREGKEHGSYKAREESLREGNNGLDVIKEQKKSYRSGGCSLLRSESRISRE